MAFFVCPALARHRVATALHTRAAVGERTIAEQGEELFRFILDVASGRKKPYSEQYGWVNDLCVFNPAPIT